MALSQPTTIQGGQDRWADLDTTSIVQTTLENYVVSPATTSANSSITNEDGSQTNARSINGQVIYLFASIFLPQTI